MGDTVTGTTFGVDVCAVVVAAAESAQWKTTVVFVRRDMLLNNVLIKVGRTDLRVQEFSID